jgi:hypothetical protein
MALSQAQSIRAAHHADRALELRFSLCHRLFEKKSAAANMFCLNATEKWWWQRAMVAEDIQRSNMGYHDQGGL